MVKMGKRFTALFCSVTLLMLLLPADNVKASVCIYNIHNEEGTCALTGVSLVRPVLNYRTFSQSPYRAIWWSHCSIYSPEDKDATDYRNRKLSYRIKVKNTGKNEIKELGFCFNTAANGKDGACPYAYHMKKSGFSDTLKSDNRHRNTVMEKDSLKVGEEKTIRFSYGVKAGAVGIGVPAIPNEKYPICMYIPKLSGDTAIYRQGDEITITYCQINPGWDIIKRHKNYWKVQKRTLYVGQTKKIKTKKGLGKLKWKSDNSKVAAVSQKGKVTAKKAGVALINVTGYQVTDQYLLRVAKPCFKKKKVVVKRGREKKLKINAGAGKKKYKSANPSIATVSSKGVVRGKRRGTTVIRAKYRGYKMKCKIIVK